VPGKKVGETAVGVDVSVDKTKVFVEFGVTVVGDTFSTCEQLIKMIEMKAKKQLRIIPANL